MNFEKQRWWIERIYGGHKSVSYNKICNSGFPLEENGQLVYNLAECGRYDCLVLESCVFAQ